MDGTLAHNLLEHGTGALHIDACRVPFRNTADGTESKNKNRHADFNSGPRDNRIYGADKADRTDYTAEARFTPNMLFDQSTAKELHPTVKPVELMRWLVRLTTPEGGLVLEPFACSGTTLEACAGTHAMHGKRTRF